jgi:large subunit ribosomal protein L29
MKMSEVKALSLEEVNGKLAAEKETLKKLKFAHAISPIENPMKIRVSRKVVAQLETELRSRQLAK